MEKDCSEPLALWFPGASPSNKPSFPSLRVFQTGGKGSNALSWLPAAWQTRTVLLALVHLAAVLHSTGSGSGASLPGEVSLGMGAAEQFRPASPHPLLFPPAWNTAFALKTKDKRSVRTDVIRTGSHQASPSLEDNSTVMGEK